MAAHQAPQSLGFSRQEHWSGLPFPSPMRESESEVAQLCLTLSDPMNWSLPGSSVHGIFQGKSTGVGCHCLLRYTEHSIQKQQNTHSSAHGTFSTIDHILGQKLSLSKFLKLKIISSIFCDHNTIRLEINYKKKKKPINYKNQKHIEVK